MPSSPLLDLAPRKRLHQTGPTSPQLTRSEPSRRPSRTASLRNAGSRAPAQSLYTDTQVDSCAVPELPSPRNLRQQRTPSDPSVSDRLQPAGTPEPVYDKLQPSRPAQTPGQASPPGAPAKLLNYAIPGKGDVDRASRPQNPPLYPPIVYADLQHPTPPQSPNQDNDSNEAKEMRKGRIYSQGPLPAATPSSPYLHLAEARLSSSMLPTEKPMLPPARSPSSKRMPVASVGDFGKLDSGPSYADSDHLDYTFDKIDDDAASYVNTARLSTGLLDAAWAPPLPPRGPRRAPPPVAPKPDYLHSRNPFAKPGPPDPYVASGAVVGLTKKAFKKFIRDLDAAFVLFYNPCDQKCCGAKVHMRQAAHTTQKPNHAYAAVDCTKECALCRNEKITSFPTMKLYVKGMTVDTYSHVPLLSSEIRNFVENAPIVRETVLEKSRCVIQ